jgi:hypothetical protein
VAEKKYRVKMPARKKESSHNSALSAKVAMRRWLAEQLGGKPMVLDCFCAGGMLWDKAYGRTERYVGLDVRQFDDDRRTIVTDSRRFLRHQDVRLEDYEIIDLDAFGSPLEHLAIICDRIRLEPGRKLGICLTDGTGFNSRMNGTPRGLLHYVGMNVHRGTRVQGDYRTDIFNAAVNKALRHAKLRVLDSRSASKGKAGAGMVYVALLLQRVKAGEDPGTWSPPALARAA